MVSLLKQAEDGQVQGIGGVGGEDEATGIRAAEEAGQALTGAFQDVAGLDAEVEARPPRVDPEAPVELVHERVDGLGLGEGRGGVVQVDEIVHEVTSPRSIRGGEGTPI